MSLPKIAAAATSIMLMGCVALTSVAHADGMEEKKPATPLDKAIDDIQNKQPPISVAPPAPEPVIEQTPPPAGPPAPAPETRIVEVQPNTSFFGLSIGAYDVTHGKTGAAFNMEWQPGVHVVGFIQPLFGAFVTTKGSVMGYGGIGTPFHLGKHIFLMPSFSVGAYGKGGGYDLGRTLAFRAGTELAYEFDDKSRIGLNIHAIGSGESLKRKDRTEIISLVYTIPFDLLSGRPKKTTAAPAPAATAAPAAVEAPAAAMPVMAAPSPAAPAADSAVDNGLKK